jgi:hypothetical protein
MMKKYSYILLALVLVSIIGVAFSEDDAARSLRINPDVDTLTTSTSLDTVTYTLATVRSAHNYEFQVNADSLTGATGATCYLEQSSDAGGTDWVAVETVVVNGVTTRQLEVGSLYAGTLRCRCMAPSSTQSTAVRVDLNLSPQ